MTACIEIDQVSFTYPDGTKALQQCSMKIPTHKKIAVLGSNGCGKSTLFLHINGILQPSKGSLIFQGEPYRYSKKNVANIRKEIGLVFQNAEQQIFHSHVLQDVAFGALNIFHDEAQAKPFIERAIAQMQIEPFVDKPVHFLSYGQKKRVAIAGVLAMNPSVLVLDEPTAGLDAYYSEQLMNSLETIHQEGKTILVSTHDIEFAYEWADEFIIMEAGRLLAMGDHAAIFQNDALLQQAHVKKPLLVKVHEALQTGGGNIDELPKNERDLLRNIVRQRELTIF